MHSCRTRRKVRFKSSKNIFDVLFRALHRRQAAGVFAGKRFGAGLKKQNKEVTSDESRKRQFGPFDDLRKFFVGHAIAASLCCQMRSSGTNRLPTGSETAPNFGWLWNT